MPPDLNAATGPKQPLTPIRLVLGKFDPERSEQWDTSFTCFELDTGLWFGLSAAKRARYRKRFGEREVSVVARTVLRTIRDPETLSERLRLIEDELQGVLGMHSLSSGRRVFELEPEDLWARALRSALGDCRSPVALEWGERDSSAGIRRRMVDLPGAGWLIDPDTHLSGLKGRSDFIHYKLHGWHPDRWVRRYGQRRAKELIGRIRKAGTGAMLVLSHSGRIEEFKVFSEAIEGTEG